MVGGADFKRRILAFKVLPFMVIDTKVSTACSIC